MNIAEIAEVAFDAVDSAIEDAVHDATLGWNTQGAYNFTTGAYAVTANTDTGRVTIATDRPVPDRFPQYTRGAHDEDATLEGFSTVPEEGHTLTVGSTVWHIMAVQDVGAAGTLFNVILRKVLT